MRFFGGKHTKNGFVGASVKGSDVNDFFDNLFTPKLAVFGLVLGVFLGAIVYAEQNMLYGAILYGTIGFFTGAFSLFVLALIGMAIAFGGLFYLFYYLSNGP